MVTITIYMIKKQVEILTWIVMDALTSRPTQPGHPAMGRCNRDGCTEIQAHSAWPSRHG